MVTALLRSTVGVPPIVRSDVIHRLVHEEEYRAVMQERLDNADLDGTVFARDEGAAFRRAVDFLVANHERLKVEPDRSPICIGR